MLQFGRALRLHLILQHTGIVIRILFLLIKVPADLRAAQSGPLHLHAWKKCPSAKISDDTKTPHIILTTVLYSIQTLT